jgi:photosystem II stability/assembly factor-like uncharacterized protein
MREATSRSRWPAVALTLLVLAAFGYSFSPRPLPPFPATQVAADGLLLNSVARQGDRWIAVGELGHVLWADDPDGPWHDADVTPRRGSNLTRVRFVDDRVAVAVGQDGWIIRSTDGGAQWDEVNFEADLTEPLLDVSGPHDGVVHAVGGFGLYRISRDLGQTWSARPVTTVDDGADDDAADASNPFAMIATGLADRHLNTLVALPDGGLLLAGEAGALARSDDGGETWRELDEVYAGSFFGALATDSAMLVYGMRGHIFRSTDGGATWQQAQSPDESSLFGGVVHENGDIVLVGASGTLLVSEDDGVSFHAAGEGGRDLLADVRPLANGWLTVGEDGVRRHRKEPAGDRQ